MILYFILNEATLNFAKPVGQGFPKWGLYFMLQKTIIISVDFIQLIFPLQSQMDMFIDGFEIKEAFQDTHGNYTDLEKWKCLGMYEETLPMTDLSLETFDL